jgi:hypothetical protein
MVMARWKQRKLSSISAAETPMVAKSNDGCFLPDAGRIERQVEVFLLFYIILLFLPKKYYHIQN